MAKFKPMELIDEMHGKFHTDSIVQVIEHPPQKYVPKFYKWSTAVFWILIVLLLLYVLIKFRM